MMVLAYREFGSWPGQMQELGCVEGKKRFVGINRDALAKLLLILPIRLLRHLIEQQ